MKIHCLYDELVDLDKLKPHPKNRNKHPEDQIKRLAQILMYQGWRYPVKVSKLSGHVTSGHGRIEAAKLNGWKNVPVNFQNYDNEDQEYADVQADNAIASWSELDFSAINTDIGDLGPDFDIDLLGIKNFEIEMADKFQGDPDEVPDVPKEPKSKLGDLYILGNHRLLCGDSTKIEDVEKLMMGEKADMVFTDPPYGIAYKSNYRSRDGTPNIHRALENDSEVKELLNCLPAILAGPVFVCTRWDVANQWIDQLNSFGLVVKNQIIWIKSNHSMGDLKGAYGSKWEAILFAHDGTFSFPGQRPVDIWDLGHIFTSGHRHHPTEKTVKVPEKAIEDTTNQGARVLDLFGGSGSTLIACEKTKRKCFMMEIDPHYCDVIVSRYVKFTGNNKIIRNGEEISWEDQEQR